MTIKAKQRLTIEADGGELELRYEVGAPVVEVRVAEAGYGYGAGEVPSKSATIKLPWDALDELIAAARGAR